MGGDSCGLKLLPTWHESLDIDTVLVEMHNRLLQAKVPMYQCQMTRLKQLDEQMKAIKAEMFTIIPKKHQCVERCHGLRYSLVLGNRLDSVFGI